MEEQVLLTEFAASLHIAKDEKKKHKGTKLDKPREITQNMNTGNFKTPLRK